MSSTDYWPRPTNTSDGSDSRFEQLGTQFQARLRLDLRRLHELVAKLAPATQDTRPIYEDLRLLAHRLGGAAVIFEVGDIGAAAGSLEAAATAALGASADSSDAGVWAAINDLMQLLVSAAHQDND